MTMTLRSRLPSIFGGQSDDAERVAAALRGRLCMMKRAIFSVTQRDPRLGRGGVAQVPLHPSRFGERSGPDNCTRI